MATFRIKGQASTPSTPPSGYGVFYVDTDDKHLKFIDDVGTETDITASSGGGETNTASNVTGTTGVGLYKTKVGVDLQFKSLLPGSNKLTVSGGTSDVTIDVAPSNIAISGLSGYDANQHVDHTSVSISSGGALTGGGSIAASRTITLDVSAQTALVSGDPAADYLLVYDTSASAHKKILPNDLGIATGETNTISSVGAGTSVVKGKTGVDLRVKSLTTTTGMITLTSNTDDVNIDVNAGSIPITSLNGYNANKYVDHTGVSITAGQGLTGGGNISATRALALDLPSLSTVTPADADSFLIYDDSGATHAKVLWNEVRKRDDPNLISNIGLTSVHSAGTIVTTITGLGGTALSSTNKAYVSMRHPSTLATGHHTIQAISSNLSLTIPNAATLGCAAINSVSDTIYVYLIWDGATVDIAMSRSKQFNADKISSATTISGGATSGTTLYSNSTYASVATRLIGKIELYESTWGTWTTNPTLVSINSLESTWDNYPVFGYGELNTSTAFANNVEKIVNYAAANVVQNATITTGVTWKMRVLKGGYYEGFCKLMWQSTTVWTAATITYMRIYKNNASAVSYPDWNYVEVARTGSWMLNGPFAMIMQPGEEFDIRAYQSNGGSVSTLNAGSQQNFNVRRITEF